MKLKILLFAIFGIFMIPDIALASTFSNDTDLMSSTYADNLIKFAESQVDNFYNNKYVVFRNGDNYYLITSHNYTLSGNTVTFTNSTIISAIRTTSGYNTIYNYSTSTEASSTLNISHIVISNLDNKYSTSSSEFNTYNYQKNIINIGVFILGICFAIFLTKERSYL